MLISLSSFSIIRSSLVCLHRITLPLPPPSLTFIFSKLSSYPSLPLPHDDALLHDTQAPHNPISEFLLNECGLSLSHLTKVMRAKASPSRTRSSETARGAVEVLRDSGFTSNQVIEIIIWNPSSLQVKANGQLKLKIDLLETLGLTGQSVVNVVCMAPRFLTTSLENTLVCRVPYLEKLFGSRANVFKAIRQAPGLLYCDVEKQVNHKLDILKQYGVQGELLSNLISKSPEILTKISEESLNNMGLSEDSKLFYMHSSQL